MSLFGWFSKRKKKGGSSNAAYYQRENMIHNVDDLTGIIHPKKKEETLSLTVEMELVFKNMPLSRITQKLIQQQLGKPVFAFNNTHKVAGHTVLFYRDEIDNFRFLIQFHFINMQFFYICNKISTSGVLSESNKTKIVRRVLQKYIDHEIDIPDSYNIRITDSQNNQINTRDEVYFYVNYLIGGEVIRDIAKKFSEKTKHDSQKGGFTETLDKYI